MSNSSSLHINDKMYNNSSHDFVTPVKMNQNIPDTQRAFGSILEENNNLCISMPESNNEKKTNTYDIASNTKYKGYGTDLNNKSFHSFKNNLKSKSVIKTSRRNNESSELKINDKYNINSSIDIQTVN